MTWHRGNNHDIGHAERIHSSGHHKSVQEHEDLPTPLLPGPEAEYQDADCHIPEIPIHPGGYKPGLRPFFQGYVIARPFCQSWYNNGSFQARSYCNNWIPAGCVSEYSCELRESRSIVSQSDYGQSSHLTKRKIRFQ